MLKQRILTISILLPLFIWLLCFSSNIIFLWITLVIISLAGLEWLKLLKLSNKLHNLLFNLLFLIIVLFATVSFNKAYVYQNIYQIVQIATVFWILALGAVLMRAEIIFKNLIFNIISLLLALVPSWLAISYLKIHNKYLLIFACSIIIGADIGAYVFGKLFGKHKLTSISPGKTWEGVLGGYLGSLLVAAIYYWVVQPIFIFKIILITTVTFIFSVVGDLFESLLKRHAGVKDSGNILPGHGGILDRLDSFCSGMPVFLFIFLLIEKYL